MTGVGDKLTLSLQMWSTRAMAIITDQDVYIMEGACLVTREHPDLVTTSDHQGSIRVTTDSL